LNDSVILNTAQIWLEKKQSFEKQFYDLKIPDLQKE